MKYLLDVTGGMIIREGTFIWQKIVDPKLDSPNFSFQSILGYLFNLIQVDYKIAFVEEAKLGFLYQNQNVRGRQELKKGRSLILCTVASLL